MKNQNSLFGIRWALILVLGLTLVSGHSFAQTLGYYAYTANSGSTTAAKSVSEYNTRTNTVTNEITYLANPGQGIALPADADDWATVTETSCSGISGQECVSIVDFLCYSGLGYKVTPVVTGRTAQFVAITPYISSTVAGNNHYAYVTTGGNYVDIVTYASNACTPTYGHYSTLLPQGSALDTPSSFGVAIANNGKDAWVTDQNAGTHLDRPYVYRIDTNSPSSATTTIIPLTCPANCTGACCPSNTPRPRHIAYASINGSTYNMYVTDGATNRAVWVVQVTLDANQNFKAATVLAPIIWPQSGDPNYCNMSIGGGTLPVGTTAISVNSNATTNPNTIAYVTSNAISNRLFIIQNLGNANGGTYDCAPHTSGGYPLAYSFVGPRGLVWIPDGRAYVGNDQANQVNVIQTDPTQNPILIATPGKPLSVAVTLHQYLAGPSR
jgi:hypothetical protein